VLFARYKRVVVPCPTEATGGPEAVHQLAWALKRIGVPCHPAYYGKNNALALSTKTVKCSPATSALMEASFGHYGAKPAAEIELDEETLLVLTEGLGGNHPAFTDCGIAVWWLSVDNALITYPAIRDLAKRRAFVASDHTVHLWQSVYARDWLREAGVTRLAELADFTSDIFTAEAAGGPSPRAAIAYNAAKGADLASGFFAEHPEYDALPLRGFSKADLKQIFSERLLYVDFGHLPGKDRLPREAAAAGSIVFVPRRGAGAVFDDFPVPDFFRFSPEDIASGELHRRLQAVLNDPRGYWDQQADFRSLVRWERHHFDATVARLWGRSPPL